MNITRIPYQLQILDAGGPPRSKGQHLSDIIRNLALRGKQLKRQYANKIRCGCQVVMDEIDFQSHKCDSLLAPVRIDDMSPERIELGLAWEERLPKHHPEICFHPGEVEVDGISMTIDGATFSRESDGSDAISIFHCDGEGALHEFKLTWKSMNKGVDSEWMWLTQQKGYLYGLKHAHIMDSTVSFLHVFWVNGNYRRDDTDPDSGPRYVIYRIDFSRLEIRENFDMIRAHRDRMVNGGHRVVMEKVRLLK